MNKKKLIALPLIFIIVTIFIVGIFLFFLNRASDINIYSDIPQVRTIEVNKLMLDKLLQEFQINIPKNKGFINLFQNSTDSKYTKVNIEICKNPQPLLKVFTPQEYSNKLYSSGDIIYENSQLNIKLYVDPDTIKYDKNQYVYSLNTLLIRLLMLHAAKVKGLNSNYDLDKELISFVQKYLPNQVELISQVNTFIYVK